MAVNITIASFILTLFATPISWSESRCSLNTSYISLKNSLAWALVAQSTLSFFFHFKHAFGNCFVFYTAMYSASTKSSSGYGMAFFILTKIVSCFLSHENKLMMCLFGSQGWSISAFTAALSSGVAW